MKGYFSYQICIIWLILLQYHAALQCLAPKSRITVSQVQQTASPAMQARLRTFQLHSLPEDQRKSRSTKFGKESDGLVIDPKRFIAFNLLAVVLAIGANFVGITSSLLSSRADYFRDIRADIIYPINGYQRYYNKEEGFEFLFPINWRQDPRMLFAKEKERETPLALRNRNGLVLPVIAYGPAKSQFKENISVIKSKLEPGFVLETTLGPPVSAAEKLLATSISPPKSGKTSTLIDAHEEIRNGLKSYVFEYLIDKEEPAIHQHTISVIQSQGNDLFTFTATVPQQDWTAAEEEKIRFIEQSFKISN